MRSPRSLPVYRNPFASAQEIRRLSDRYVAFDSANPITEQHCLAAGAALRGGDGEREALTTIFRWKLQAYFHRFPWVREFPNGLADDEIALALSAARRIEVSCEITIAHALKMLDHLPRVGTPVASTVLMAMYPEDLTVIDRQAYKMLAAEFRDPVPADEYLSYVAFCRAQAAAFAVSLRDYDRALWWGDDAGRRRRPDQDSVYRRRRDPDLTVSGAKYRSPARNQ
jgi:hypothetical protein